MWANYFHLLKFIKSLGLQEVILYSFGNST